MGIVWMIVGTLSVGCSFVYARYFLSPLNLPPVALATWQSGIAMMCAEKTGGFNLVNYRHSSGVYHEQETEDLHRRI